MRWIRGSGSSRRCLRDNGWDKNMSTESVASWVRANRRIRRILMPVLVARRRFLLPFEKRREQMLSRVVDGNVVFHLDEFGGDYEIEVCSDIARRIILLGEYEASLAACCAELIDPRRDAIDVGANVGLFSGLMASLLDEDRRVLSIEPAYEAYNMLRSNLKRNGLDDRVTALQMVASDREGDHTMNVCRGKGEYSSIGPVVHEAARGIAVESRLVPWSTIDALCDAYCIEPGFIKMDVEGYEHRVLLGAEATIRRHRPIVVAEIHASMLRACGSDANSVVSWFRRMDYRVLNADCPFFEANEGFQGELLALPR